jgi:LytS/YehU family sensor histidine kinase
MRFQPDKHQFIIEFNSSMLIAGLLICVLFVLLQWKIIKTFSSSPIFSILVLTIITLLVAFARSCFTGLLYSFWLTGHLNLQVNNNIIANTIQSVTLIAAFMGVFYVAYFSSLSLHQKEQIAKNKALADEAQLLMLRYQINPHFLFNSLNAIQSMVEKDKTRAKDMIADLSDFFRYTLSKNNQTFVALKEEIEAIQKYLAIQKERFAGRIKIDYEIDEPALKIMVPFFIIHPLVENAIKYGFSNGNDVLCILIKATYEERTLNILIKNTGTLVKPGEISDNELKSTKTGINNIKKRLSLFYPDCSSFELFEKDRCVNALITISNQSVPA